MASPVAGTSRAGRRARARSCGWGREGRAGGGGEAGVGTEETARKAQVLLPPQRVHRQMRGAVLNRQLVDVLVVRCVVMDGPPGRRQHQVARLPLELHAVDDAVASAGEEVVDGGG